MSRIFHERALAAGVAFILFAASTTSYGQGAIDIDSEVLYQTDATQSGTTAYVAIRIKLEHGYHVNANKPLEDFLIPTVVTVEAPDGISLSEVVYPEPIEIVTGGSPTPMAVYEEEFVVGLAIDVADSVKPGAHDYTIGIRYQACNDKQCLMPRTLKIKQPIKVVAASAPLTEQHAAVFAGINFTGNTSVIETIPEQPSADITEIAVAERDVMGLLDQFDILGTSTFEKTPGFLQFIEDAKAGKKSEGMFEGKGPIVIVLLVLAGGLALNLTPCVLPLVPINLAIIGAGAQAGSRSRGFVLGLAYGLAMAFVYGVLGLIVILTAGTFGTINASPWFNIGIAILFVFLALAMFDVIQIDFSKYQSNLNLASKGKKGSLPLAFGMGGVSALLAGACVAPIVIQVIVFSSDLYAKGTTMALSLPFFLGLGMAIPWPLAGGGMSVMPKPGAWMIRVKQAMGVFILGFSAYYGYLGYKILDSRNVDTEAVANSAQEMLEGGWTPSMTTGLEEALADDKVVIVDMWATWCKNCLIMDKTTLKDADVEAALEDFVKIKFQAEDLDASPANEILKHFEGIGLPTYAILRPKKVEN